MLCNFPQTLECKAVVIQKSRLSSAFSSGVAEEAAAGLELGLEARKVVLSRRDGGVKFYRATLLAALKACSSSKDMEMLRVIHTAALESGDDSNIYVANSLVDLYAKCGLVADARRVFEGLKYRNVVSWTTLMFGYVENGEGEMALDLFERMRKEGFEPNERTYVAALKACSCLAAKEEASLEDDGALMKVASLQQGTLVHAHISQYGCEKEIITANTLVDMYGDCGDVQRARLVFDRMRQRSIVSWNAMLFGHVRNGEGWSALELFERMQREGFAPNDRSFVAALRACILLALDEEGTKQVDGKLVKAKSLRKGIRIHREAVDRACDTNIVVSSTLVEMYATCGSSGEARQIFERMERRTSLAWNAMVLGYAENGEVDLAIEAFQRLRPRGCKASAQVLAVLRKVCPEVVEPGNELEVRGGF